MRLRRLIIADLPDAPPLDPDEEGAVRWDYENGKAMILAQVVGEWCWLWIHNMATFRFPLQLPPDGIECVAAPHPNVAERSIVDGYYRMVVPMLLQVYGLESMHGTAVVPTAAAAAIAGASTAAAGAAGSSSSARAYTLHAYSTTGKSTLTLALAQRGYQVVADDALILDPEGAGLVPARPALQPIPFAMRLREPSAELFGRPVREKIADPGDLGEDDLSAPLPLAGFVLIERVEDGPVVFTRLAPQEGFKRLLDHCYTFDPFRKERTGRMMKAYLKLAREVPVVAFRYPSGLDKLPAVADELARHLETGFGEAAGNIP